MSDEIERPEAPSPLGAGTENRVLADLVGQRVRIWSVSGQTGYTDEGTLAGYDHPWLRLRTRDGEVLCFPVYCVRLVKLVGRLEEDHHIAPI